MIHEDAGLVPEWDTVLKDSAGEGVAVGLAFVDEQDLVPAWVSGGLACEAGANGLFLGLGSSLGGHPWGRPYW